MVKRSLGGGRGKTSVTDTSNKVGAGIEKRKKTREGGEAGKIGRRKEG